MNVDGSETKYRYAAPQPREDRYVEVMYFFLNGTFQHIYFQNPRTF